MTQPAGLLHVVATPIGNLGDLSPRAAEVLRSASRILAEDTRHSRVILDRCGATAPVEAYHEHNEAKATPRILERLSAIGAQRSAALQAFGSPQLAIGDLLLS